MEGTLDTTFNYTGIITTDILTEISCIKLQLDGKIVVGGYLDSSPNGLFALARYI